MALDRENRPDMILSKLSANYLGAISNIFLKIHKIFFNTIPAPWVLILKGGNWLLIGHLLEVLLKSKIISIQIFYGRIFLSFLNEWILYSSDSKHHIWPCHCLRHHWIRLQKIFLRFLIWSSALQACWCCFDLNFSVGYKLGRGATAISPLGGQAGPMATAQQSLSPAQTGWRVSKDQIVYAREQIIRLVQDGTRK